MNATGLETARNGAPFRVGEALSEGLRILTQHFVSFLVISAIAHAPNIYIYMLEWDDRGSSIYYSLLETASDRFFGAICQAAVVFATFQSLRGRPVSIGQSITRTLSRLIPVVLTSVLVTVIVSFGTVLLLVPGIIANTMLAVALPACIVEALGPGESLSRSASLTKGHRGSIFGVFLAFGVATLVVGGLVGLIFKDGSSVGFALVLYVCATVLAAYLSVVVALIYHGLRVAKEGIDINQIAAVFD